MNVFAHSSPQVRVPEEVPMKRGMFLSGAEAIDEEVVWTFLQEL